MLIALLLICSMFGASLAAEPLGTVVGTYKVEGKNPDGKVYDMEIRITGLPDGSGSVEYIYEGRLAAIGLALRTGDVLSVAFQGQMSGVASYKISKDRMSGEWTLPDVLGIGTEKLTRIPKLTTEPVREQPLAAQPGFRVEN